MDRKRPKIALVLGGGGSRGIAHIGVLEVIKREQIPIDLIVGTSMGAIVGCLYAAGIPLETIIKRMSQLQGNNFFSVNIFSGRARQKTVEDQLAPALQGKTFADLNIPTIVMAVDMLEGREVPLSEGLLIPAILASSAVPAVFPPVNIQGRDLADGGVVDSLATHVAHSQGADKIIAVDVYPPLEKDNPWVDPISAIMGFELPFNIFGNATWSQMPSMLTSMWRSFRIMAWHVHEERLRTHPADLLLRPKVENYGSLDFTDIEGPLTAGREIAEAHIDDLRAIVQTASTP